MKTIAFIALGSLAAFLASLAGTYVLMPMIAPDIVEAERMQGDSLAAASPLAAELTTETPLADSLQQADTSADSAASSLETPPSSAEVTSPSAETTSPSVDASVAASADNTIYSDSIAVLQQRLAAYESQLGDLQREAETTKAQRARASELASTLIKLEDRDLAQVLARLDLDVLTILYSEASARNRARLLGALEPSRTALFVRRVASAAPQTDVPS